MKVTDREYALELDKNDPLAQFKSRFVITDPDLCYLDGNSLGRLPHETVKAMVGATGLMRLSLPEISSVAQSLAQELARYLSVTRPL
jgi:hypothetical protein